MVNLWVDKYRPNDSNQLNFHQQLNNQLDQLALSKDLPHLIFFGPSGAGKSTRVHCLLKSIYGSAIDKVKIESRTFVNPSNKKLDIDVISSPYHLEMNPSDLGIHDRFVIQSLIKEIAQSQSVDTNAPTKFKIIVISQADQLSKEAQQALRRTMEKYMGNLRLILVGDTVGNLIGPIKSRCFMVRVPRPQHAEIRSILQDVANEEGIDLPTELSEKIAIRSDRDLRKALLMLQAIVSQNQGLLPETPIPVPDWEKMIFHICSHITKEQSPKALLEIRTQLYELISRCIPAKTIIKMVTLNLINMVEDDIKQDIVVAAAEYEYRLTVGSKAIFHLEAFVAKVMSVYKRYLHKIQDEFDY